MNFLKHSFVILLILVVNLGFAQQKTSKDCPCTKSSAISDWTPNFSKGYDTTSNENNFAYSVNGIYLAEDRDSLYQIKLIVDAKPYAKFVTFQHLSFSKKTTTLKQVTNCETLPNVHDGGWIGQNIFKPSSPINKRFVASQFSVGDHQFKVSKNQVYRFYKCNQENNFGIHDANKNRYYRKVRWEPRGDFTEISLFGFTQKDVKKFSKEQLATMRNEIYARYNYAFAEGGNWYKHFENIPDYRWNYFKDVKPFITVLEKENIQYVTGFEGAEYYDNQFKNDFLDFWEQLRVNAQKPDLEKLKSQIQFPFLVGGDVENIPSIKITKQQFDKIWPLLLQQENYGLNKTGKPVSNLSKNFLMRDDAFGELMLNTKTNSIANFNFEKLNGVWKFTGAYADDELHEKIKKLIRTGQ